MEHVLDVLVQGGVDFVSAVSDGVILFVVSCRVFFHVGVIIRLVREGVAEGKILLLHQLQGGAVDRVAGEIAVVGSLLLFLDDAQGLGDGFFVLFLGEHVHLQHTFQHFIALFQGCVRVENRVVS